METPAMFIKRCSRSIFLQVVIGLVIGVICGVGIPDLAVQMKPLGDGFIKLIKMLIALIVFCVVVNGISGAGDLKKVGRIGLKSVIYFEILTTIALVLGLVVAYSLGLGSGANIHLNELPAGDVALYTGRTQEIHGPVAFLMGLIPTSVFSAFAENDILQVLLFSVLFGSALNLVGEQASGVARLINEFSHIVFRIMGMIVRLAPLGVFGAVAFTTARYGVDSLSHLGALVLVFYATCLVFVMAVLGSVLRLSGVRMLPFLRYFGIGRALTNLIGNCVATVTIARWENDIDMPRAQAILDGRLEAPAKADGEPLKRSAVAGEGKLHG
ncbi:cation:dicarboxylate symporter family transporter [Pseudomonas aeruginosa]|uniref:cation:dicarboxylate symporter family transporter n=1 Tax=Pseudomonas aeruginosa TaxID=287 RepID=UPI0010519B54|nr:cation:dicarboxylase symporter family transporter [Pseudomonas aeruginosa]